MLLTALLVFAVGLLLVAPPAFAGCADPAGCEYGEGAGPPDASGAPNDPNPNPGGNSPSARGAGASSGGSSADGTLLGPDPSVSPAGGGGASGGGSAGEGSDLSTDSGSSGPSSDSADDKASKALNGRSLGEVLSGGTERVASAKPAVRAGKAVSEDGGGAGLLWLLLALGAVTAVAAGGVAVRRRQARQGYLR
jgi:hypothetical protein